MLSAKNSYRGERLRQSKGPREVPPPIKDMGDEKRKIKKPKLAQKSKKLSFFRPNRFRF
jgi:hypothetical protein